MIKYYAVSLSTESSDHYTFLIHGESYESIVDRVAEIMDEELEYVYDWQVAADDVKDSVHVSQLLGTRIEGMQK